MYYSPQVIVKDTSDFAQQINLKTKGRNKSIILNYSTATPWTNKGYKHYIFRKTGNNWALIDSVIGAGNTMQYEDKGLYLNQSLVKGIEYEYVVKTIGKYGNPKVPKPLPNLSPIAKGSLFDSTPPCKPVLIITSPPCSDCSAFKAIVNPQNLLSWTNNSLTCDSLVKQYKVYYKAHETDEVYTLIGTTSDTFLYHSNTGSLAGCYYVQATSFSDIIGPPSNEVCLDNCVFADLPNVFTPNGDSYNQVFRFICAASSFIKNTQVRIYNRWGNLIYDSPQVAAESLWDGKAGNKLMEDGMYYYEVTCDYQRLSRADERLHLKGWLMLLRD
jgi:gliding motility-associated-like protein